MANDRLYNLSEQASYSSTLKMLIDDSGFTAAKYIAVGTLAPKVDAESTIANGSVNTATFIMRLNNGSGDEYQKTLDDFFSLFTEKFNESKVRYYRGDNGNDIGRLILQRIGNIITGIFKNEGTNTWSSYQQLYEDTGGSTPLVLPSAMRPEYDFDFNQVYSVSSDTLNKVRIKTDGTVYVWRQNKDANAMIFSYIANSF
jgi:hypothetical protein